MSHFTRLSLSCDKVQSLQQAPLLECALLKTQVTCCLLLQVFMGTAYVLGIQVRAHVVFVTCAFVCGFVYAVVCAAGARKYNLGPNSRVCV